MHFCDINREFTDIVQQYLNRGYVINSGTMCGTQSNESARVDLTDGKEIVRIITRHFNEHDFAGESIIVGIDTENVRPHISENALQVVWNSKLNILYQKDFYLVGKDRQNGDVGYYGTKDEAIAAEKLRRIRVHDKAPSEFYCSDVNVPGWERAAIAFIQRVCCKKRVREKDLRVRRDNRGRHFVTYRGEIYALR